MNSGKWFVFPGRAVGFDLPAAAGLALLQSWGGGLAESLTGTDPR